MKHLLIAGGGTGGHITPALAVGQEAESCFKVSYACTPRPVDQRMYSSVSNTVHIMNPPRVDKGLKIFLPFTALYAFVKTVLLLKRIKVDIVLGTGGYSSFFTILAAKFLGKPAAVFDSNALPGRSNRLASKFCQLAFTSFTEANDKLSCSVVLSGTPITKSLRNAAKQLLKEVETQSKILFLGGSQGARSINDIALSLGDRASVLLQSGSRDYKRVEEKASALSNFQVKSFLSDLLPWYSEASLVVARAGAQTIAEVSALGIPAVFVPYPYAAEDHQTINAKAMTNTGSALWFPESETKEEGFDEMLLNLLKDKEQLKKMARAARSNFKEDSAQQVVLHLKELS